jgi:hypothetical protein
LESRELGGYKGGYVRAFKLIPFPAENSPDIQIVGEVNRAENGLSIHFAVSGDINNIVLPEPSAAARKHDLWKATCFEFFLAVKDRPEYWEFNLSPSGDWNVYAMDAYRQVNMREESAFSKLPFEFTKSDDELALDCAVNLSQFLRPQHPLLIGVTAIIQTTDGSESYWALAHPGKQADFHLRESFVIELVND